LNEAGLSLNDISVFEMHEAFAGQVLAATGGRLLIAASRRLLESGGEYALISACAAGAQGNSILLKRID